MNKIVFMFYMVFFVVFFNTVKISLIPKGMTFPEMALKFILSNADVTVTIPGMSRRLKHYFSR